MYIIYVTATAYYIPRSALLHDDEKILLSIYKILHSQCLWIVNPCTVVHIENHPTRF